MVRMCDIMTLACATVMAAGTVATADDKAAAPVSGQPVVTTPGSFAQVMGEGWSGIVSRGGHDDDECDCDTDEVWWNGNWDGIDGQVSHEGGGAPQGAVAADDFFLCDGFIHSLRTIEVTILNNSQFGLNRGRLEIYSDCNGCPDELLYVLREFEVTSISDAGDGANGFTEYLFWFDIDASQDGECPGEEVDRGTFCELGGADEDCTHHIALRGGTYWISFVGRTDGQGSDLSFWGTTGDETNSPFNSIKGSVAKKRESTGMPANWNDPYDYDGIPWTSVEECCVGCTDLAFRVCYDSCKILLDNGSDLARYGTLGGSVEEGARSERSGLIRNSRAADDFVVPPCRDFDVCYIEGCVYTNCDPAFRGFFEIYANDCNLPDYEFGDTPICSSYQDTHYLKRICLDYAVTIDGVSGLDAYLLQFHDIDGCRLDSGQQYWISIGVNDSFSFIERGYFCRNSYCDRECDINFNPGAVLDPANTLPGYNNGEGIDEWTSTAEFPARYGSGGTDFSFLIAGDLLDEANNGPNAGPACAADADNNGIVEVTDIFTFLSAWFAGCP